MIRFAQVRSKRLHTCKPTLRRTPRIRYLASPTSRTKRNTLPRLTLNDSLLNELFKLSIFLFTSSKSRPNFCEIWFHVCSFILLLKKFLSLGFHKFSYLLYSAISSRHLSWSHKKSEGIFNVRSNRSKNLNIQCTNVNAEFVATDVCSVQAVRPVQNVRRMCANNLNKRDRTRVRAE